tara:strand:+ start:760 stop:1905 length:1146 start_codon:yes stop_codon:yes gene_type:complete
MSQQVKESEQLEVGEIDEAAGIIKNVKVLGRTSGNRRIYTQEAMERGAALYEGVSVFIDHGNTPGEERSLKADFGILKNVSVVEGAIRGDLHYWKTGSQAAKVIEKTKRAPRSFGLSHDAVIDGEIKDGVFEVTEIIEVRSVDLVTSPATTAGIFESEREPMKKTVQAIIEGLPRSLAPKKYKVLEALDEEQIADEPVLEMEVEAPAEATADDQMKAAFRTMVLAALDDDSLDTKATLKKIKDILNNQDKLVGGDVPAEATEEEDGDDPAGDGEEIKPEDEEAKAAVESLTRTVKKLEARIADGELEATAVSVLESSGFDRSPEMIKTLKGLKTIEAMESHIADNGDFDSGTITDEQVFESESGSDVPANTRESRLSTYVS